MGPRKVRRRIPPRRAGSLECIRYPAQTLGKQHGAVRADHITIEPAAPLDRPLLRLEVDMHDAEPLREPCGPFEIVQQRPDVVAAYVDALLDRAVSGQ